MQSYRHIGLFTYHSPITDKKRILSVVNPGECVVLHPFPLNLQKRIKKITS